MTRPRPLLVICALALLDGCFGGEGVCTEIACESRVQVSYGLSVAEPYTLYIDPNGTQVAALCLGEEGEEPVAPDWLDCNATGFTITGSEADLLTIVSVTVVPVATEEAVIENVLVTLSTDEVLQPNGEDCEPTCYERSGSAAP